MRIYGIHPVVEALRAKRVTALRVSFRADDRLNDVVRLAEQQGIPVRRAKVDELDRFAKGGAHQGVVADVHDAVHLSVEDLVTGAKGAPLIVVLDQIEDPHNVGAILRTVDAAGADGVVRQSRHAAPLDGAAGKASAGAVAHVRIAEVVNIARAIEDLKQAGVWTCRACGGRAEAVRRGRFDAADGDRRGRGGDRPAAAGSRAVRLAGVDPDAGPRSKSERLGGRRHCSVRGASATTAEMSTMGGCSPACRLVHGEAAQSVARVAQDVLKCTFCAGWRSSAR